MASKAVKAMAALWGISPAQIYKARELQLLRPDLYTKCEAGEMSLHSVWKIAKGKTNLTPYEKATKAYNELTDEQRAVFIVGAAAASGLEILCSTLDKTLNRSKLLKATSSH